MKNVHYKILNLQVKQEHNYTKFGKTHCGFERQTFTPQETEKVDRRDIRSIDVVADELRSVAAKIDDIKGA